MFRKQSQFELFPGAPAAGHEKERSRFSFNPVALTFENAVVASVVFLMSLIIAFAFGVEQGKRRQSVEPVGVEPEGQISLKVAQVPVYQQVQELSFQPGASDPVKPETGKDAELAQSFAESDEVQADAFEKSVDKTASLDKIHTVQVASFKQQERADREAGTLTKKGFEAFVAKKGSYYIVCVGKYRESSQASGMLKDMRKIYKDCLIRSL